MVVADRIAVILDTVYGDYSTYHGWYLIVASSLFAFQIYCDFSGYLTIAMGAAEIMGFWHGSQWNFAAWGGINGLYQITGDLLKPMRDKVVVLLYLERTTFSHKLFQMAVTFGLIDLSWVFFRANRFF